MRDLTEDPHPAYTAAMMADLTGRIEVRAPTEPVDGKVAEMASQLHAEASEARRASEGFSRRPVEIPVGTITIDALLSATKGYVHAVWDLARAKAAGAGPMPLVGTEPWVEGDEAYRKRLEREARKAVFLDEQYFADLALRSGHLLDNTGAVVDLPRAWLVPMEGCS